MQLNHSLAAYHNIHEHCETTQWANMALTAEEFSKGSLKILHSVHITVQQFAYVA